MSPRRRAVRRHEQDNTVAESIPKPTPGSKPVLGRQALAGARCARQACVSHARTGIAILACRSLP